MIFSWFKKTPLVIAKSVPFTITYEKPMSIQEDKFIERPLPVGMAEFNEFADRIIKLAGPYADEDSMKFALASIVIHADATKGSYSDAYFLERLRKSAANQVASQVFQDIKIKQAEQLAKQQAEATAANEAATDDNQKKD